MRERLEQGLIQVYTGNSKGKTTASLGLALRAVGHGFRVYMIQFLKGSSYSGEIYAAERLYPNFRISQFGRGCPRASLIKSGQMHCTGCGECFIKPGEVTQDDRQMAAAALAHARAIITSDEYDIVILDEISSALTLPLISIASVQELLDTRPARVELILTGRNMPTPIIDKADLVTEMVEIKHPFRQGIPSRRGIEY
jgi:cob(I)alamin adenosyltransferase